MSGLANYLSGHVAEHAVAQEYVRRGAVLLEHCWRCDAGEIDLILRDGETFIFAEVKSRKTQEAAASAISLAQWGRIAAAAEIYLYETVGPGLHQMRFDAAFVDPNGKIKIVENATQF